MGRKWNRRWLVYGNYTGPGNPISADYVRSNPPIDDLDRAAYRHDLAYSRLGKRAYWRASAADARFVRSALRSRPSGLRGKAVKWGAVGFFTAKNLISGAVARPLTVKDEMVGKRAHSSVGSIEWTSRKTPRRMARISSGGSYIGPMRKPRRAAPVGAFTRHGVTMSREMYGTQSGADVVYLGVPSYRTQDVTFAVACALMRKILKKHFFIEVANVRETINYFRDTGNTADPGPIYIQFYRRQNSPQGTNILGTGGNLSAYGYAVSLTADVTFGDLCADFAQNVLMDPNEYFGAYRPSGLYELYGYRIVYHDRYNITDEGQRAGPIIPINDDILTVYQTVRVGIQNVTSADGTLGDPNTADRIDRNPLMGKLFKFKSQLPQLREPRGTSGTVPTNTNLEDILFDINRDGMILPASTLSAEFAQIPKETMFRRLSGVSNVNLEPGNIKDFTIKFKFRGKINDFMRGVNWRRQQAVTSTVADTNADGFGTCMLLALEKRMSTGAGNCIVNFQYDTWFGAVWNNHRPVLFQPYTFAGNNANTWLDITAGEPAKDNATA